MDRERKNQKWLDKWCLSLSLSPLTAEHRRKGVRNCYIPDFTESEWVWLESNDGCQLAAALSAPWSSQRSLFIVQTPGTRNLLPSLSTHTLTSSTFTPFSTFNSRMKDPFYPPLKASSLSLFCKFYPQNMLHGTLRVYETLYFRCKHP